MTNERVHIIVIGKLQGVFFRASTHHTAEKLNIKGWVKNLDDGSVEIVAEGVKENLRKFISWCNEGSEKAKVTEIKIKNLPSTGEFTHFYIKY